MNDDSRGGVGQVDDRPPGSPGWLVSPDPFDAEDEARSDGGPVAAAPRHTRELWVGLRRKPLLLWALGGLLVGAAARRLSC